MRVAVSGLGNVGLLLGQTLMRRRHEYADRFGIDVRVVGVCGSRAGMVERAGLSADALANRGVWSTGLFGDAWMDGIVEAGAEVLFEVGPSDYETGQPGLDYLRGALSRGIHVVAVSKGALVCAGEELSKLARANRLQLFAGAAGAAGMPLIDFLSYDLAGANVRRLEAVLTGTSAFVLDDMVRHGRSIEQALERARELGISEADPTFDLDGWDTAAKLVIISGLVFGEWMSLSQVARESVRDVTPEQVQEWRARGVKASLVGVLNRSDGPSTASVRLREYEASHPYSSSRGSTKGAFIYTEEFGEYSIIGGASSPVATVAAALKDFEHLLARISPTY